MIDHYARVINYMRISITDRCNLRCSYCMPTDVDKLEHESILTYEEILRICHQVSHIGIKHIKITGGEPLVRKDAIKLMQRIKAIEGIQHVTLTTNGVLLEEYAEDLKKIPLDGVNVSLDTLKPEIFQKITGKDDFGRVWKGLLRVIESGIPTKINCVPQKGINDKEIMDMVELAVKRPVDVRFIEMMPIGYGKKFQPVKGEEIYQEIFKKYPDAASTDVKRGLGPATYITSSSWKGNIGFINPISHKFCASCNRIRLTSRGHLKPCLCYGDSIDLMASMRDGISDRELMELICKGIDKKPWEHNFEEKERNQQNTEKKEMYKIGG